MYNATYAPLTAGSITLADGSSGTFTQGTLSGGSAADFSATSGITTFSSTTAANKNVVSTTAGVPSAYPRTYTLLAYVKVNDATNRGIELDMNTGAERVKAVIYANGNGFGIEKTADGAATIKDSASYSGSYHLFQVSANITAACTGTVTLWVDGSPVTLASSTALTAGSISANVVTLGSTCLTSTSSGLYIGDGGSSGYNADIDWIVWSNTGAYTPTEVKGTLPASMGTIPAAYQ
ncbi:hypothetical protein Q9Q94_03870 [Uliginosibacterium sp. 31-16]|uniref:hypothetical protein n=1 Tax=Uliginosibacterium sp. 31-16 TaxID=3068315 RepID=UPI00273CFBB2|nr:hypothetical protein [Uliginosibacterium sp. 31-16]MDP5238649.1 hypothetical protein [Uliginosibacterium sp. 31-16]